MLCPLDEEVPLIAQHEKNERFIAPVFLHCGSAKPNEAIELLISPDLSNLVFDPLIIDSGEFLIAIHQFLLSLDLGNDFLLDG